MSEGRDFEDLGGGKLSGVCFVMDYVELHFHGPVLRCLSSPVVIAGDSRIEFPATGSRDALCALIDRVVEVAEDAPDRLVVRFGDDLAVEVPKASEDAGPEIAHFVPIRDGAPDVASMMIWENLIPTPRDSPGSGMS